MRKAGHISADTNAKQIAAFFNDVDVLANLIFHAIGVVVIRGYKSASFEQSLGVVVHASVSGFAHPAMR